ncbi:hypothetical protein KFE25_001797 [Diacronema lutheri]|uniref:Uncharacterized protein n=1 Tax=Diacronema lutheri TaxID=2081491 RepID=A0A8J5XLT2_DIALT|nr:hypothetical protein KFE25_001797 [Diacronema lutheri]
MARNLNAHDHVGALHDLSRLVAQEEASFQRLRTSVSRTEAQLASLRSDIADQLARSLPSPALAHVTQLDKLRARYEAVCQAHEAVREAAEAKRTELDELQRGAAAASGSAGELSHDRHALASAQAEWKAALDAESSALNQSKLELLELERQVTKQRQAVDVTRREATGVKAHNAKLTRQLDEMRRKLDKVAIVRSSAEQARAERHASATELERELAQEQTQLASLRADQEQLEAAVTEWERYVAADGARRADAAREARDGGGGSVGAAGTDAQRHALVEARGVSAALRRQNEHARRRMHELQRMADQPRPGPPASPHRRAARSWAAASPAACHARSSTDVARARDVQADERELHAQASEERALLLQREAQWAEYCAAVGADVGIARRERPSLSARAGEAEDWADWALAELQRENEQIRRRIARLQRAAESASAGGTSGACVDSKTRTPRRR